MAILSKKSALLGGNTGTIDQSSDPPSLSSYNNKFNARIVTLTDLTPQTISAWVELEQQALEPNAYLSPYFIIPAIKYLELETEILIILIEKIDAGRTILIGVGVFRPRVATRKCPLPHLQAYASCHSFLTGLLIHRCYAEETIRSMLKFIRRKGWHGVEFNDCADDGTQAELIHMIVAEMNGAWFEYDRITRAVLIPAESGESHLARLPAGRRNDLRRCWRRL